MILFRIKVMEQRNGQLVVHADKREVLSGKRLHLQVPVGLKGSYDGGIIRCFYIDDFPTWYKESLVVAVNNQLIT